jgi:hypothetical protein
LDATAKGSVQVRSSYLRRLVLVLLGAIAAAGVVVSALRLLGGTWVMSGCAIAAPLGWTLPITTAFVVIGVAWLLMSQKPDSKRDGDDSHDVPCSECGRSVRKDWRLCPYCAAVLDRGPGMDTTGAARV